MHSFPVALMESISDDSSDDDSVSPREAFSPLPIPLPLPDIENISDESSTENEIPLTVVIPNRSAVIEPSIDMLSSCADMIGQCSQPVIVRKFKPKLAESALKQRPIEKSPSVENLLCEDSTLPVAQLEQPRDSNLPIVQSPVPLRLRSGSHDYSKTTISTLGNTSANEKETYETWRERIWPSKALLAFVRVITRCKPQEGMKPPKVIATNDKLKPCLLRAWKKEHLTKIVSTYDSAVTHHAAFLMVLMEECKESLNINDEFIANDIDFLMKNSNRKRWQECSVEAVVTESAAGKLPQGCNDAALSCVWVVRFHVNKIQSKNNDFEFISGDLVALHSENWAKPLLGVVQGWDPDYEVSSKCSGIMAPRPNESDSSGLFVNIMMCVDQSESIDLAADKSGWATNGMICVGVNVSVAIISNVLTFMRECQALASIRVINKPLQQAILRAGSKSAEVELCSMSTASSSSSLASQATNVSLTTICPESVPLALWKGLKSHYNNSQLLAIRAVCCCSDSSNISQNDQNEPRLTLLQGPPGTGKTKTILALLAVLLAGGALPVKTGGQAKVIAGASLKQQARFTAPSSADSGRTTPLECHQRQKILLCAPSNTAVDELVFRIKTQGVLGVDGTKRDDLSVVRIGQHGKGADRGSVFLTRPSNSQQANMLASNAIAQCVEACSLDFLVEERRRGQMGDLRKKFTKPLTVFDIRKSILERADVVCCTLSGAGSQPLIEVILRISGFKFDAVIIDEAAQATEPSALIPFKYNPRSVVLVGDPCQLPAVVFSPIAKELNYSQGLFQRMKAAGYPVHMLETQYRMHPSIAAFPSDRYYGGNLGTDPLVLTSGSHDVPYHSHESGQFRPFVFHNLLDSRECCDGMSFHNHEEVLYAAELCKTLAIAYPKYTGNIGIIAPYAAQRKALKKMFTDKSIQKLQHCDVEISTVDGFQGREKDIIIFTCVRSLSPKELRKQIANGRRNGLIGFLKEWQRLNVAITRAKFALWIVGNIATLETDSEWSKLIEHSYKTNSVLTVSKNARGHYKYLQESTVQTKVTPLATYKPYEEKQPKILPLPFRAPITQLVAPPPPPLHIPAYSAPSEQLIRFLEYHLDSSAQPLVTESNSMAESAADGDRPSMDVGDFNMVSEWSANCVPTDATDEQYQQIACDSDQGDDNGGQPEMSSLRDSPVEAISSASSITALDSVEVSHQSRKKHKLKKEKKQHNEMLEDETGGSEKRHKKKHKHHRRDKVDESEPQYISDDLPPCEASTEPTVATHEDEEIIVDLTTTESSAATDEVVAKKPQNAVISYWTVQDEPEPADTDSEAIENPLLEHTTIAPDPSAGSVITNSLSLIAPDNLPFSALRSDHAELQDIENIDVVIDRAGQCNNCILGPFSSPTQLEKSATVVTDRDGHSDDRLTIPLQPSLNSHNMPQQDDKHYTQRDSPRTRQRSTSRDRVRVRDRVTGEDHHHPHSSERLRERGDNSDRRSGRVGVTRATAGRRDTDRDRDRARDSRERHNCSPRSDRGSPRHEHRARSRSRSRSRSGRVRSNSRNHNRERDRRR